jgi:hypothetical protein
MRLLSVRLSVLALALTGFAASTVVSKAATHKAGTTIVAMGTTPVCMCSPHDPTHCGLD